MHQTHDKKPKNKVFGQIDQTKVARGHWAPTGGGRHHDKRTKRQRTRSARFLASVRD